MKLDFYQIDTFTDQVFKGNAAGVCPLKEWLDDSVLLNIAAENNLSETAFYVPAADGFEIRWFTPNTEIDLCGHATLASSFVIFNYECYGKDLINFYSPRSGKLTVTRYREELILNFPADEFSQVDLTDLLISTTDHTPIECYKGKTDYMIVFESEQDILQLHPDLEIIAKLPARGIIVTAKGTACDFVSRFFGPAVGVAEDQVTGSAHTTLVPYWSAKLGKTKLLAKQLSQKGGTLYCSHLDTRVEIGGQAAVYLKGEIYI